MNATEIIKECLKRNIYVSGVELRPRDTLVYIVDGFSKSGSARIYDDGDEVKCETRYGQVDTLEDFRDLAWVAFEWNKGYCDREPFGWDTSWTPVFIEFGWLEKKEKVVTEYKVK